ncbi:MAG TPA: PAC2 family protein [Acidimicrobiia bacterium]
MPEPAPVPDADGLVWDDRPELLRPVLVAGFEGWNDAGNAASDAAAWLTDRFGGSRFAWIDPEEHFDYQSRRPEVELTDGVTRSITWPSNDCFAVHVDTADRDIVVLRGIEPSYRWRSFCRAVLTVAAETGCEMVVTLGALLADVPHTRPVSITGSATDPDLIARLALTRSRYEGPTGIVGVLHDACRQAGVASASLWAPVPHYVATPPNPMATRALLDRFGRLVDVHLALDELDDLGDDWRRRVDEVVAEDDDVREYVRKLEERAAQASVEDAELPSGEDLAAEFEQFLRDQGPGSGA